MFTLCIVSKILEYIIMCLHSNIKKHHTKLCVQLDDANIYLLPCILNIHCLKSNMKRWRCAACVYQLSSRNPANSLILNMFACFVCGIALLVSYSNIFHQNMRINVLRIASRILQYIVSLHSNIKNFLQNSVSTWITEYLSNSLHFNVYG